MEYLRSFRKMITVKETYTKFQSSKSLSITVLLLIAFYSHMTSRVWSSNPRTPFEYYHVPINNKKNIIFYVLGIQNLLKVRICRMPPVRTWHVYLVNEVDPLQQLLNSVT